MVCREYPLTLIKVTNNNAFVGLFEQRVLEPYQFMLDPLITNRIELEDDCLSAIQEL